MTDPVNLSEPPSPSSELATSDAPNRKILGVAAMIGLTVPVAGAERLYKDLNALIDAAVAEGWVIREDNRK